jgi:hypothetical protein
LTKFDPYEWSELTMNNPRRIQRHLVKALAAGAVLVAAALPMAIASVAGAAVTLTSASFNTTSSGGTTTINAYFGTGASGTFSIAGGFAGDGETTATVTTTAPGVTFSSVVDTSTSALTGSFVSTSATTPGSYPITVTDNNGTATLDAAFTVNAAPTVSSVSPTGMADTTANTAATVTLTGAGFVGTPKVYLTSTVDGTKLTGVTVTASGGTIAAPVSTLTVSVTPENLVNSAPATPGTYTFTVVNPDGGQIPSAALFTVTGNEISEISPSAVPNIAGTYPITVSGGGFTSGAQLTLATCTGAALSNTGTVTGAGTMTDSVVVTGTPSATGACVLTVTNTTGNTDSYSTIAGALGLGQQSTVAPLITASSLSAAAAVLPGAPQQAITFTGTGFSQYTTPTKTTAGTSTTSDTSASIGTTAASCLGGQTGTTLTCELTVTTGATAGAHSAVVDTSYFPNAFSVAGPTVTSAAPTGLAVGAPVGTIVVLTGTGFGATTSCSVTVGTATGLAGICQYVSPTTENFVVTGSPTAASTTTYINVSSYDAYGAQSIAAPFALPIGLAPTISSITYVTGTTGVGVGATAQTIVINGSGFSSTSTVTNFVNGSAVADPAVTATVTGVNLAGTQLTATVKIAAGDTNTVDGYTVTNPNGGTSKATAVAPAGLVIQPAPTITAVSPVTATPASTNAFTITGTGFLTGATVVLSSGGTCGSTTVVSATSMTVSCTFGPAGTSAVSLVVTNPNGGSATSAVVLAAATPPPVKKPVLRVTAVHGVAKTGHTVTITLNGTGFYGQPKITSTAKGTKAVVFRDTGKALQLHVTATSKSAKGMHTFTIRLANGKTCKANYRQV